MAVAAAPVEYERQAEREHIVKAISPAPRWGPPIWPAEEPIAALDRASVTQVDIIILSMMLAYRSE